VHAEGAVWSADWHAPAGGRRVRLLPPRRAIPRWFRSGALFAFRHAALNPSTRADRPHPLRAPAELNKNPPDGVSVGLGDDENIFHWEVLIIGPSDTMYEGGFFKAKLEFPPDFPNNPPAMTFTSEMWHPNIFPDGKVCISILHPPGEDRFNSQESADIRWRPILGVEQIIISVVSMLSEPCVDSPANLDAGVQLREQPAEYKKRVRATVRKSQDDC
jgi:ubiquitin-conjugating enzyme E2 G1